MPPVERVPPWETLTKCHGREHGQIGRHLRSPTSGVRERCAGLAVVGRGGWKWRTSKRMQRRAIVQRGRPCLVYRRTLVAGSCSQKVMHGTQAEQGMTQMDNGCAEVAMGCGLWRTCKIPGGGGATFFGPLCLSSRLIQNVAIDQGRHLPDWCWLRNIPSSFTWT